MQIQNLELTSQPLSFVLAHIKAAKWWWIRLASGSTEEKWCPNLYIWFKLTHRQPAGTDMCTLGVWIWMVAQWFQVSLNVFVKHGLNNLVLMKSFVNHGLINYVLMTCELLYYRSRHLGSRMPFDNDCGKHFFHPSFKRGRTTLWPYRNFLLDWWDTAHHIHSNNGLHDCNYHIGEMSVYHCPIEGLCFMHLDHCFTGKRINSLQIYH